MLSLKQLAKMILLSIFRTLFYKRNHSLRISIVITMSKSLLLSRIPSSLVELKMANWLSRLELVEAVFGKTCSSYFLW